MHQKYATSSEKISVDQLGLFNEAEELNSNVEPDIATETTTVKSHERKTRPRISIPAELPREEVIHDLSDSEKVCPKDGTTLEVIGSEDHEQLDIILAQIKVLRHRRLKYACPCCEQHVVTASKPKQPIEKTSLARLCSPTSPCKNTRMHYRCIAKAKCLSVSGST